MTKLHVDEKRIDKLDRTSMSWMNASAILFNLCTVLIGFEKNKNRAQNLERRTQSCNKKSFKS